MATSNSDFIDMWLSEACICPECIEQHIKGKKLDLSGYPGSDMSQYISSDPNGYFKMAQKAGLPPLPHETKHFKKIVFHQKSVDNLLAVKPSTSLWQNLDGAHCNTIKLSLSDTSLCQGLNKVHCKNLILENMNRDWTFDDLPRLGTNNIMPTLSVLKCSEASKLIKTLANYIKKVRTPEIRIRIIDTSFDDFDQKIFETLFNNFGSFYVTIRRSSLQRGFLESHQKVRDKLLLNEINVIPPFQKPKSNTSPYYERHAKRQISKFVIDVDIEPFRKTDFLLKRSSSLYWTKKDRPPNPKMLRW